MTTLKFTKCCYYLHINTWRASVIDCYQEISSTYHSSKVVLILTTNSQLPILEDSTQLYRLGNDDNCPCHMLDLKRVLGMISPIAIILPVFKETKNYIFCMSWTLVSLSRIIQKHLKFHKQMLRPTCFGKMRC